ncbi:MAG: DUF1585 domain-containing protein [Candidatus Omnitrophica bacterium]|nr:DUF1585 domain-containing protein [Candidatus Omnitrophota bacterium]
MAARLVTGLVAAWGAFAALWSASPARGEYVFLSHPDYIRRLAMDLIGGRPSQVDLQTPPEGIPNLVEAYMTTEQFGERILWLANDIFLTRFDLVEYFRESYDYADEHARHDVAKAVGEEPVRLFEYIVRNDLPLAELVTADYTIANSTLAWFWNIEYNGEAYGSQWLRGRYLDGREHAGVLSQTSFYYRYPTTVSNKQRHRANQITRIFLDDDHMLRNVSVNLRLGAADPNLDLVDATRHNTGCVACHSTLDGIGAHVFGFSLGPGGESQYARELFSTFSPQGVERWQLLTHHDLSYYGYPSRGLRDLGNYIAKDPRFARTMVKHIYRFFLHRDPDYRDRDILTNLATVLVANNYSAKALIKAIVSSDEYRAVGVVSTEKNEDSQAPPQPPFDPKGLRQQWLDLEREIAALKVEDASKREWTDMARVHAIETGYSLQTALGRSGNGLPEKGTGSYPDVVEPLPPEELIQPFKLATPEQLHSLGKQVVGEIWDGYEGGQWLPPVFPHLEYNTDIKVVAGGYDGRRITERKWAIPPTYLLVLERWAEVLAEDVLQRELGESVHWAQRRVFTLVTGREDPREAEPAIRNQIADWFKRFYGETVDPWGPEVDDVFGVLLYAREQAREMFGDWYSIEVGWSHVLGMMLSDIRMAIY